ncbi:BTAD domain-containing putative transcriptional regulator [Bradyrhizobium yuanmingense]|uniref:AfsR/SARP family transcriptional regulator n=1 Tax=Bradyrhizobium yuanmingense TaxID=108015 RepID=UPI0023B8A8AC|nr:BTAD domain-containing putative transcriptional regulator [Bradyrhizobium yuanmingense]MDF0522702.1 BTAD domain-containing putative transcriptional regulator [Bradyrhizobium yuanmingense]
MRAEAPVKLRLASVSRLQVTTPQECPGESAIPAINIRLFGTFSLGVGGDRVDISARLAAILAYLARRSGSEIPRDRLAGLYWGRMPGEQARRNVRVALFRINQLLHSAHPAVPARLIQSFGNFVSLPRHSFLHIDANEFETVFDDCCSRPEISAADLLRVQRAVELYREDLLPDLGESWIIEERESLRSKYLSALKFLILACLTENDHRSALYWCERAMKVDIGDEETAALAMKIASQMGNRSHAVKTFRALALVLRREFGIAPSTEMVDLLRGLTSDPPNPVSFEIDVGAIKRSFFGYAKRPVR